MEFFKQKLKKEGQEMEKQTIESTINFKEAVEGGELEKAEKWLSKIKENKNEFPQYDDRWIDHRERELFQAYYKAEDWTGAKRIVEASANPASKEGRIRRLEELSGTKFNEII